MNDMSEKQKPSLVCVYSLPRSGSTVLIAELDRLDSVICLPESYFPQVLELLSPEELADRRQLAAYFMASSPSGSLLTFEEAEQCMVPGDWAATLSKLGTESARKIGRSADEIKVVIWKTTRIIGRWRLFHSAGGRFVLLRRHKYNVFESQFRVQFGIHNRNPLRFAVFHESYEAVFTRLPAEDTFEVEYDTIPDQYAPLRDWLKVSGDLRAGGESSLESTHAGKSWHGGLLDGFKSKDHIKRENVVGLQRILISTGIILVRPLRPLLGYLRDYYDKGIMQQIRTDAIKLLDADA